MKKQAGLPAMALAEAGQTLLEILLAFSVSILVLSAIILGITTSLSNTQYTKNQGLANSYAQEGITVIKKIRDSTLDQFSAFEDISTNTKYCLGPNAITLTDGDKLTLPNTNCWSQNPVGRIFSREVEFQHDSDNCCDSDDCSASVKGSKVTVAVSWSDSKCPEGTPFCHDVKLITCFSKVDKKVSP